MVAIQDMENCFKLCDQGLMSAGLLTVAADGKRHYASSGDKTLRENQSNQKAERVLCSAGETSMEARRGDDTDMQEFREVEEYVGRYLDGPGGNKKAEEE